MLKNIVNMQPHSKTLYRICTHKTLLTEWVLSGLCFNIFGVLWCLVSFERTTNFCISVLQCTKRKPPSIIEDCHIVVSYACSWDIFWTISDKKYTDLNFWLDQFISPTLNTTGSSFFFNALWRVSSQY